MTDKHAPASSASDDRAHSGSAAESGTTAETLLFVCTGNVCRSPYAEMSLRAALPDTVTSRLRVTSAGTAALEGDPVAPLMADILTARGVTTTDFRARQLTTAILARATIVVTAEREHRRWVTRLDPSAATRTFTLSQVARLLEATAGMPRLNGESPLKGLVARLAAARGLGGAGSEKDDIEDPWGRRARTYRRVASRLDGGLAPLVDILGGEPVRARAR